MASLTHHQRRVAHHIISVGHKKGASRQEILAAIETGLVESNLSNPRGGDGTSVGWRQETASSYPGVDRRNVRKAAARFYDEIKGTRGKYRTAGQRAQAVQRSAYPARYDQRKGQAKAVLASLEHGAAAVGHSTHTKTVSEPGYSGADTVKQARRQFLLSDKPSLSGLMQLGKVKREQADLERQFPATKKTVTKITPGKGGKTVQTKSGIPRGKPAKGTANFEGHKVAAWIKPYLVYGRKHGWKGTVNSGYRSFADQTRIYNSGVRPAARPGTSNHEGSDFPRGAVDVSDAAGLNRILRRRGTKRLQYAGAKDPVHFSHPHGGSY